MVVVYDIFSYYPELLGSKKDKQPVKLALLCRLLFVSNKMVALNPSFGKQWKRGALRVGCLFPVCSCKRCQYWRVCV